MLLIRKEYIATECIENSIHNIQQTCQPRKLENVNQRWRRNTSRQQIYEVPGIKHGLR